MEQGESQQAYLSPQIRAIRGPREIIALARVKAPDAVGGWFLAGAVREDLGFPSVALGERGGERMDVDVGAGREGRDSRSQAQGKREDGEEGGHGSLLWVRGGLEV